MHDMYRIMLVLYLPHTKNRLQIIYIMHSLLLPFSLGHFLTRPLTIFTTSYITMQTNGGDTYVTWIVYLI